MIVIYFIAIIFRILEIRDKGSGYGLQELGNQAISVTAVLWADSINMLLSIVLIIVGFALIHRPHYNRTSFAFVGIIVAKIIATLFDWSVHDFSPATFFELSITSFILPLLVLVLIFYRTRVKEKTD